MAIAPITVGDVESISKINQAIVKANLVDDKASVSALDALEDQTASELASLSAQIDLNRTELAQEFSAGTWDRPGEASFFWTEVIEGNPSDLTPLSDSLVTVDSEGSVVRVAGAKTIGPTRATRIEPGRQYRVRFVVRRRQNPADPANHTVRLAIRWLGRGKGALSSAMAIVEDLNDFLVTDGRAVVEAVVARAAGTGVDIVAPAGAVYARPYVQTYGDDGFTDIEVVEMVDITNAIVVPVDVTQFESRVESLETADAATRLDEIESQIGGAQLRDYLTRGAVESATISETVDAIRVAQFDPVAKIAPVAMRRVPVEPAHPGKVLSGDGAWWENAEAFVNPYQFKAIGDGMANDYAPLAEMFQVAAASKRSVVLPPGDFFFAGNSFEVPFDVRIMGSGRQSKLKVAENRPIFIGAQKAGFQIEKVAFQGDGVPGSSANAINLSGATLCEIVDCYFDGLGNHAIRVSFDGAVNSERVIISRNFMTNLLGTAVFAKTGPRSMIITDNQVDVCDVGIFLDDASVGDTPVSPIRNIVANNLVRRPVNHGISLVGARHALVTANLIEGQTGADRFCIEVANGGLSPDIASDRSMIVNNLCRGGTRGGILINGSSFLKVSGNMIEAFGGNTIASTYGILITDGSSRNHVTDNHLIYDRNVNGGIRINTINCLSNFVYANGIDTRGFTGLAWSDGGTSTRTTLTSGQSVL